MVFKSNKQRKGFFANIKNLKANHEKNVLAKLKQRQQKEEAELARLRTRLEAEKTSQRLRTA